ncbi:hypothetical protein [Ornithobacterium rhinotracheale]|uniref:hypothetical protein n=1 Tax=Ornithobacterium rhinotracheale TaxID=28251 RepID=UPI004035F613
MKKLIFALCFIQSLLLSAQTETPPMGFMTWNYFGVDFNENVLRAKPNVKGMRPICFNLLTLEFN